MTKRVDGYDVHKIGELSGLADVLASQTVVPYNRLLVDLQRDIYHEVPAENSIVVPSRVSALWDSVRIKQIPLRSVNVPHDSRVRRSSGSSGGGSTIDTSSNYLTTGIENFSRAALVLGARHLVSGSSKALPATATAAARTATNQQNQAGSVERGLFFGHAPALEFRKNVRVDGSTYRSYKLIAPAVGVPGIPFLRPAFYSTGNNVGMEFLLGLRPGSLKVSADIGRDGFRLSHGKRIFPDMYARTMDEKIYSFGLSGIASEHSIKVKHNGISLSTIHVGESFDPAFTPQVVSEARRLAKTNMEAGLDYLYQHTPHLMQELKTHGLNKTQLDATLRILINPKSGLAKAFLKELLAFGVVGTAATAVDMALFDGDFPLKDALLDGVVYVIAQMWHQGRTMGLKGFGMIASEAAFISAISGTLKLASVKIGLDKYLKLNFNFIDELLGTEVMNDEGHYVGWLGYSIASFMILKYGKEKAGHIIKNIAAKMGPTVFAVPLALLFLSIFFFANGDYEDGILSLLLAIAALNLKGNKGGDEGDAGEDNLVDLEEARRAQTLQQMQARTHPAYRTARRAAVARRAVMRRVA